MGADIVRNHIRNGEPELARVAALAALQTVHDDDEIGELHALLARALFRLGQPHKALVAAEEAAKRLDHWEVHLALAEAMVGLGEAHPARALLAGALKKVRDADSHAIADAEVWLGAMLAEACRAAGDPETGIGVATRAVGWAERHHGLASPEAGESLHELGVCLHAAGQHAEARQALERALAIRRTHSTDTYDMALTLDALGATKRKLGKPFQAVQLHRQALAIWRQVTGKYGVPEATCRHALAQAIHATGDFVAAEAEMSQAYALTEKSLGLDHVDTWITRFELGRFEMDVGRPMEGMARMEEARSEVIERLGLSHPVVSAMNRWL